MDGGFTTECCTSWLVETSKPSLGNTRAAELTGVEQGSGDSAEQAASNEKQAENPASPRLVPSHLSGSACIFLSPDCREIGSLCAGEVWLAWGRDPQHHGAGLHALKQRQPDSSWVEGLESVGGGPWHLTPRLSRAQDPWDAACPNPILGAAGWRWQHPSDSAWLSPSFHVREEEP